MEVRGDKKVDVAQCSKATLDCAARSTESVRELVGLKWNIQQDMRNMKTRKAVRERGVAEQFVYKQMRQEINSMEANMERIVQICIQQSRPEVAWLYGRLGHETQQLIQDGHALAVRMHKLNEEGSR